MGIKWYGKIVRLAKRHINQCVSLFFCTGCLSCRLSGLHTTLLLCVCTHRKNVLLFSIHFAIIVHPSPVLWKVFKWLGILDEISSKFIDYGMFKRQYKRRKTKRIKSLILPDVCDEKIKRMRTIVFSTRFVNLHSIPNRSHKNINYSRNFPFRNIESEKRKYVYLRHMLVCVCVCVCM